MSALARLGPGGGGVAVEFSDVRRARHVSPLVALVVVVLLANARSDLARAQRSRRSLNRQPSPV